MTAEENAGTPHPIDQAAPKALLYGIPILVFSTSLVLMNPEIGTVERAGVTMNQMIPWAWASAFLLLAWTLLPSIINEGGHSD